MSGQNQTNEELSAELAMLYSNLITAVISVYGDSESAKGYISSMTNEIKELIVVLAVLTNNSRGYVLADYLLDDMCHWNKNIKHITFSELKSEMEKNFSDPERNYIDVFCGCINLGKMLTRQPHIFIGKAHVHTYSAFLVFIEYQLVFLLCHNPIRLLCPTSSVFPQAYGLSWRRGLCAFRGIVSRVLRGARLPPLLWGTCIGRSSGPSPSALLL